MLASLQHNSLTQLNLFTYTYPNENIHCQGIATAVVVVVVLFGTARIIISPSSPSRGRGVQVLPGLKKKRPSPVPCPQEDINYGSSVRCVVHVLEVVFSGACEEQTAPKKLLIKLITRQRTGEHPVFEWRAKNVHLERIKVTWMHTPRKIWVRFFFMSFKGVLSSIKICPRVGSPRHSYSYDGSLALCCTSSRHCQGERERESGWVGLCSWCVV